MDPKVNDEPLDISPEAIIKAVQTKRMRMLLGKEDVDKNARYLMNELAETAVQCRKIESDEKISGDDRETAIAISNVLAKIDRNPYYDKGGRNKDMPVVVPVLPSTEIVPGEMGKEIEDLDYSEFVETKK